MGKTKRDTSGAVAQSFHRHYKSIWGEQRWDDSLYPALVESTRYAALINQYAPISEFFKSLSDVGIEVEELEDVKLPSLAPDSSGVLNASRIVAKVFRPCISSSNVGDTVSRRPFPLPKRAETGNPQDWTMTHWNLDAASILVAHLLDVKIGETVLDLCAAPGGKSIALAQRMFPRLHASHSQSGLCDGTVTAGVLHSNEMAGKRFTELQKNLEQYLSNELFRGGKIVGTNIDGTGELSYRNLPNIHGYDKVLVDAPCSSERHIIHAHVKAQQSGNLAPEMANWRPGSTKRLQETQVQLLMTALRATKMGCTVMYATCSIEPGENDGVIDKLRTFVEKERRKGSLKWSFNIGFNGGGGNKALETELATDWAERTKHGWIVLPDHPAGGRWGPLFFAMLTKVKGDG